MIIEFFLGVIGGFLKLVFGVLPSIPPMPAWVDTSLDFFTTIILQGVGLVSYLYTPQLMIFLFTTLLVLINFEYVYHSVLWIVRKLPFNVS
jgi:hypothetical protein